MRPFEVRFRTGLGHAVYSGSTNERKTDFYPNPETARDRCDTLNRNQEKSNNRTRRNCMCCGAEFDSEGIHNRLCRRCGSSGSGGGMF